MHPVFPGRPTAGGTPQLALTLTPGAELNALFKAHTGCDDPAALEALLNVLDATGILKKVASGPQAKVAMEYWVLPQERVVISSSLATMRCPVCGRLRHVPKALLDAEDGRVPCRGAGCSGVLAPASGPPHHYRQQYIGGDVFRLVSAEHTGLLKRDVREEIEKRFKSEDPKAWYPNLLSATPTLEMGIDIGDLSTVLLCSVPPTQSSYVQRVGRSGRKTGSAVNVTVANARPHDLYFFLAPEEMMAGGVRAPGVYLDAVSVLQRQFLGFALGEWIAQDKQAAFPRDIGAMLKALSNQTSVFPNTFLAWYATQRGVLAARFIASLGTHASQVTADALKAYAGGASAGDMDEALRTEVAALRVVLQGYEAKAQAITAQI
jgi:DEAD/DEAH box helicase domain-containing protein